MKATKNKITINHFLADGRQVESMKGYEVPLTDRTKVAYQILAEAQKKRKVKT